MHRSWLIGVWVLLLSTTAFGQVEITAQLEPDVVRVGQAAQLRISVSVSGQRTQIPRPEMPTVPGLTFRPRAGGGTSFSMQSGPAGMVVRNEQSFPYAIVPQKPGEYVIKGIKIVVQGKTYTAEPVGLSVLDPAAPPPESAQFIIDSQRMWRDYGVQIDLRFQKDTYYVGQAIPVVPSLIFPTQLKINTDLEERLTPQLFPGCLFERVQEQPSRLRFGRQIGGHDYAGYQFPRIVLYPLSPGEIDVKALPVKVDILQRGFLSSVVKASNTIFSAPMKLKILDFPPEGKPEGFSGAVGTYRLESSVDRKAIEVGEAITLTVTLSGEGNIDNLPSPKMPESPVFEIYDTTSDVRARLGERGHSGRVQYTTVYVAREPGEQTLKPIRYAYFDPDKQTYVMLDSGPIKITVTPATGRRGERVVFGGGRQEIELTGAEFQHIATGRRLTRIEELELYLRASYLTILVLPFFLLAGAWFWRRHAQRMSGDETYARGVRAPGAAKRMVAEARALTESDPARACAVLATAITDYIQNRWAIPARGITAEDVEARLMEAGLVSEQAADVRGVLDRLTRLRYGADSPALDDVRQMVERSQQVLGGLMRVKT